MGNTTYPGIDYSHNLPMANGKIPNKDNDTGIRYGVINANHIPWWSDSAEAKCPCQECDAWDSGNEECSDEMCERDPCWIVNKDEYVASQSSDDGDIFIIKSPFYTFAHFCSPCAPGACYLMNPVDPSNEANKCYCFDSDWFDDSYEACPYSYWSVETGELVYTPKVD